MLTERQRDIIKMILSEAFGEPIPREPSVLDWRAGGSRRGLIRASMDTAKGSRVKLWRWPDRPPNDVAAKLATEHIPYHITVPPDSEIEKAMKKRDKSAAG